MSRSYNRRPQYWGDVDEDTGEGPRDWYEEESQEPDWVVCGRCWRTVGMFKRDKETDTGYSCDLIGGCDPQ